MSSGDYEAHVARANMAYTLAYEAFEASLSASDRARLGKAAAPDVEDYTAMPTRRMVVGISADAAESPLASYRPDIETSIDTLQDNLLEMGVPKEVVEAIVQWHKKRVHRESEEAKAAVISKVAGIFIYATNARLYAAGLAYAADLALTNGLGSMDAFAKANALSRQAVSKIANFWRRELKLPGGSHMRDDKAREAYKAAQLNNHWRYRKYPKTTTPTQEPNGISPTHK